MTFLASSFITLACIRLAISLPLTLQRQGRPSKLFLGFHTGLSAGLEKAAVEWRLLGPYMPSARNTIPRVRPIDPNPE